MLGKMFGAGAKASDEEQVDADGKKVKAATGIAALLMKSVK